MGRVGLLTKKGHKKYIDFCKKDKRQKQKSMLRMQKIVKPKKMLTGIQKLHALASIN